MSKINRERFAKHMIGALSLTGITIIFDIAQLYIINRDIGAIGVAIWGALLAYTNLVGLINFGMPLSLAKSVAVTHNNSDINGTQDVIQVQYSLMLMTANMILMVICLGVYLDTSRIDIGASIFKLGVFVIMLHSSNILRVLCFSINKNNYIQAATGIAKIAVILMMLVFGVGDIDSLINYHIILNALTTMLSLVVLLKYYSEKPSVKNKRTINVKTLPIFKNFLYRASGEILRGLIRNIDIIVVAQSLGLKNSATYILLRKLYMALSLGIAMITNGLITIYSGQQIHETREGVKLMKRLTSLILLIMLVVMCTGNIMLERVNLVDYRPLATEYLWLMLSLVGFSFLRSKDNVTETISNLENERIRRNIYEILALTISGVLVVLYHSAWFMTVILLIMSAMRVRRT